MAKEDKNATENAVKEGEKAVIEFNGISQTHKAKQANILLAKGGKLVEVIKPKTA